MSKEPQLSASTNAQNTTYTEPSISIASIPTKVKTSKVKLQHLTSLQNLQNLKRNPKLHGLTYSELTQLHNSSSTASSTSRQKVKKIVIKQVAKDDYASLDQNFLRDKVPQRHRKSHISSEKRQLLLDQYSNQTRNSRTNISPRSFETIWHQTLSGIERGSSLEKDQNRRNITQGTLERVTVGSLEDYFPTRVGDNGESKPGVEGGVPVTLKMGNVIRIKEVIGKDDIGIQCEDLGMKSLYNNVKKEIKVVEEMQKDFNKLVTNAQKSYQKAQEQQGQLHSFAIIFATEITEVQKFPKELKASRLNQCLENVQIKIDELKSQEDLLQEQIFYINELLATQEGYSQPDQNESKESTNRRSIGSYRAGSAVPKKKSSEILEKMDFDGRDEVDVRCQTAADSFELVKIKTEELKIDVQKLQEEKQEYFISLKRDRASSVSNKRMKNSSTFLKKWVHDTSTELPSTVQTPKRPQTSIRIGILRRNNGMQSATKDKELALSFDLPSTRSQEVSATPKPVGSVKSVKEIKDSEIEEEDKQVHWASAVKLQEMFTDLMENLEQTIKKEMSRSKALKKDVDEEREQDDSIKNEISMQVKGCYEQLTKKIVKCMSDFTKQKAEFLSDMAVHFSRLKELNKSNLLKVESLKKLIESSVKKVKGIDKYSKKYNAFDLEDKMVRQKFDQKNDKLKKGLAETHKTLLFLAEQFKFSIAAYKLDPLDQISIQDLANIRSKFETVSKILYYFQTLPELEEEYNEKTSKAYNEIKRARAVMDSIEASFKEQEVGTAKKIREGEEPINNLKNLSVKIVALKNKLELMSRVKILSDLVAKPLLVTVKLIKKIDMNEKSLDQFLLKLQEKITIDYNNLTNECENVENQISNRIKRLLASKEHLILREWNQNYHIMMSLKSDVNSLSERISQYIKEDYPLRVPLLPRPKQKKEGLMILEKRIEITMKTLARGSVLNPDYFCLNFEDIHSSNLRGKLGELYQNITKEADDQEKIMEELDNEAVLVKKMGEDVLQFLRQLSTMLRKSFELQDKISQEYVTFKIEDQLSPSHSLTKGFQEEKEKKPVIHILPVDESPARHALDSSLLCKNVIISTLSNLQKPEHALHEIDGFIARIKGLFKEYIDEQVTSHKEEHTIYKEIYTRFQAISTQEIKILEKVRSAVKNAQENHMMFNKEVRPLTRLYKCLKALPMWNEKMESLLIVKHNMIDTLSVIKSFDGERTIRGGIREQIIKQKHTQKIVASSMDMITEVLSFGRMFSEKELKPQLSSNMRVEESSLESFLKLLERKVDKVIEMYETNTHIEEDTALLIDNFSEFVHSLNDMLRMTQGNYSKMFLKTRHCPSTEGPDFVKYLEDLYITMKELTDMFCDKVNKLEQLTVKPTWVVSLLDEFYKEIILKDLNAFSNMWIQGKDITNFLTEFKETFVELELKQRCQYRKIAECNPTKCDSRSIKAGELARNLAFLTHSEELIYRPEVKRVLLGKHKSLLMVKKVYSIFTLVYILGRKVSSQVDSALMNKNLNVISQRIPEVEKTLQEAIIHMEKLVIESDGVIKECDMNINFNMTGVLKDDILQFYENYSAWFSQLKENLLKIVIFYADLKKTFKGQVLLLRNDWVSFIKEWLSNSNIEITKDLVPISATYHDYMERIDGFVREIQNTVTKQQNCLKEVVSNVQYLNENFLYGWFFDYTEVRSYSDIISAKVMKTLDKMKIGKYSMEGLRVRLMKLCDKIEKCDKTIKYLSTEEMLPKIFEEGIKSWLLVQQYYKNKNIKAWSSILAFIEAKMIVQNEGPKEFKDKFQTVEGLYMTVEQVTKCSLNNSQKEFVSVTYQWITKSLGI